MPKLTVEGLSVNYVQELASADNAPEVKDELLDLERTIVFIHGWPDSLFSFSKVREALRCPVPTRLLSFDLVGFGRSDKPADLKHYALEAQAAVITACLGQILKPGSQVDLVGHSMGTGICMAMAVNSPDLVRSMYLVGPCASFSSAPAIMDPNDGLKALVDDPALEISEAFVRQFQCSTLTDKEFEREGYKEFVDSIVAESMLVTKDSFKGGIYGMLEDGFLSKINSVQCARTQLITGSNDQVFPPPENTNTLAIRIPNCSVIICQDAGHSPNWDKPGLVAMFLAEHLAALDP